MDVNKIRDERQRFMKRIFQELDDEYYSEIEDSVECLVEYTADELNRIRDLRYFELDEKYLNYILGQLDIIKIITIYVGGEDFRHACYDTLKIISEEIKRRTKNEIQSYNLS